MDPTPDLPDGAADAASAADGIGPDLVLAATVLTHAPHGHAHGPIHEQCENCGTKLLGPFCHRCGQHDFEVHRSFSHLFIEALETFFHFEGKFFRNLVTLLFRPGRLTAEYNAGQRARQMPPLRLYVFVSVVFFFVIYLGGVVNEPSKQLVNVSVSDDPGESAHTGINIAAAKPGKAPAHADAAAIVAKRDDLRIMGPGHIEISGSDKSAWKRWIANAGNRFASPEYREKFFESFAHQLPHLLLFCLPLFALYTRFLFRRSGQLYLQHLVLALHYHSFVYLWLLFRDGWSHLFGFINPTAGTIVWDICRVWLLLYPFLMLRELFHNGWVRTILKTFALAIVYYVTLGVGFLAVVVFLAATL